MSAYIVLEVEDPLPEGQLTRLLQFHKERVGDGAELLVGQDPGGVIDLGKGDVIAVRVVGLVDRWVAANGPARHLYVEKD